MRASSTVLFITSFAWVAALATPGEVSLGIECPCDVVDMYGYKDGGTIGGILRGADGSHIEFAWDSRLSSHLLWGPTPEGFAYVGADYPTGEGAVLLKTGSSGESEFIRLLKCFVDSVFSRERQDEITASALSRDMPAGEFYSKYEGQEYRAVRALYIIYSLEQKQPVWPGW